MPASGRHYLASAQRLGHRAEDQLHLQRLEQAMGALPRFPWETAEGSAGRWPATALIPPHWDAGQRPALPGSALRFGRCAEDQLHLQRLEQAMGALPRFPGKLPNGSAAAGRQPH
ncbi:MAG: hypothetical protein PBU97_18940 [Stenotrophomonas maltophilia]